MYALIKDFMYVVFVKKGSMEACTLILGYFLPVRFTDLEPLSLQVIQYQ